MVGKDRLGEGQHKDERSLLRLTRRRTTSEGEGGKINTLRYALYFGRSMKEHSRPPNLLYFTFVSQLQQASDLLKFGRNLQLYPCHLMLHASDSLAKHLPYLTGSGESVLSRSSGSSCCCQRSSVASRYAVTACTFEGQAESDGGMILRVDLGGGGLGQWRRLCRPWRQTQSAHRHRQAEEGCSSSPSPCPSRCCWDAPAWASINYAHPPTCSPSDATQAQSRMKDRHTHLSRRSTSRHPCKAEKGSTST